MQALKKAEDVKQKQDAVPAPREELRMEPAEGLLTPPSESTPAKDEAASSEAPSLPAESRAEPENQPVKAEPALDFTTAEPAMPVQRDEPPAAVNMPPLSAPAIEPRIGARGEAGPAIKVPNNPPSSFSQADQRKEQPSPAVARETAKAVFASKRRPESRRAIWIVAALFVVAAFAGLGYYIWQGIAPRSNIFPAEHMMPPPSEVNAAQPVAAAEATPPAAPSSAQAATQNPAPAESATAVDKPSSESLVPRASKNSSAGSRPSAAIAADEAGADRAPIQIHAGHSENRIDPLLADGYQALLSGDLDGARGKYQAVLQQDSNNRDGLLGMAAIAVRRNQADQAETYYVKLLELDPLDPDATAGLVAMRQGDPAQSESRIKKVLAQHPQAGALWFALGNVYAQQSRWAEAQQAYFRAFGNQPGNADYAFNLAVSLDRLNQDKLALEYYQQALKLMHAGQANFSEASVQGRIEKLQSALKN